VTLGRRDRVRAATTLEITQTARRILVDQGPEAVTLRAIAREMGMTAPALYRYFGSHQDLLRHLIGDLFNELTDALHAEIAKAPDMVGKFLAASFWFRTWSLAHKREYTLLFGSPFPALEEISREDFTSECGRRFGLTFLNLFTELWTKHPFPIQPDAEIDPRLVDQLERYRTRAGTTLPLGAHAFPDSPAGRRLRGRFLQQSRPGVPGRVRARAPGCGR
jgi:AcrR family transcriptional regulator